SSATASRCSRWNASSSRRRTQRQSCQASRMPQGSSPDRVADQLRAELAQLLGRDVHDPGIGFVTLTRVHLSPGLQVARVYYTALGDEAGRRNTARALD